MNKEQIVPVVTLSLICLFVSGALAVGNVFTKPVIEAAAEERAAEARKMIIPEAEDFERLEIADLPRTVAEVFRATNGMGYIFTISVMGYDSQNPIRFIIGIDPDGSIIRTQVLGHMETKGLGTRVFDESHAGLYWGNTRSGIEGINAIAGVTITSNAFKNGIRDAFAAFEIVKEGEE